jgi:hypothetical protein
MLSFVTLLVLKIWEQFVIALGTSESRSMMVLVFNEVSSFEIMFPIWGMITSGFDDHGETTANYWSLEMPRVLFGHIKNLLEKGEIVYSHWIKLHHAPTVAAATC